MLKLLTNIFPHFIHVWKSISDNPIYLRQARKKYCSKNWYKTSFSLPVILKGFPGIMEQEWRTGRLSHARLSFLTYQEILLGYIMPRLIGTLRLILTIVIVCSVIILIMGWMPWLKKHGVNLENYHVATLIHSAFAVGIQLMILNVLFFLDNFEDQVEQIGHSLSYRFGQIGAFQVATLFSFLMNSIPALLLAGVGAMFFSQEQTFSALNYALINWFIALFTITNLLVFLFVIHLQLGGVLKRSAKEFRKSLRRLENQEMQQDESAIFGE